MSTDRKVNTKVVALTLGIVWSLYLLAISIIAMSSEAYGHNVAEFIMTVYPEYALSFVGVIYGVL